MIRDAYKNTVREIAQLKPEYFCLATEINFLGIQRPEEYVYFASLYKEAYDEVKRIAPQTRVLASFQHAWIRILDAEALKKNMPGKIRKYTQLIDIFRPKLDVIGLTSYPSAYHNSPLELPADY